ncbi:MAG: hypothetical protein Q9191_008309, partial [Dirinaria sp. TL-2023a]
LAGELKDYQPHTPAEAKAFVERKRALRKMPAHLLEAKEGQSIKSEEGLHPLRHAQVRPAPIPKKVAVLPASEAYRRLGKMMGDLHDKIQEVDARFSAIVQGAKIAQGVPDIDTKDKVLSAIVSGEDATAGSDGFSAINKSPFSISTPLNTSDNRDDTTDQDSMADHLTDHDSSDNTRYRSATLRKLAAQTMLKNFKIPEELDLIKKLATLKELNVDKNKPKRKRKRAIIKDIAARHFEVTREIFSDLRLKDTELLKLEKQNLTKEQRWMSTIYA